MPADASIRFDRVSFCYDDRPVLRDITLDVPAGATVALVGPSGAGKTTLANLVGRFWDANSGTVYLGGVDVRELSPETLGQQVSFVFQDIFLFDDTVLENIRIARTDASLSQVKSACRVARAHDFIAKLPDGYDTQLGERGTRLSGGERQRIAIARAILRDAPVVVLDEATAFADLLNQAQILAAIEELTRDRTVLVIAHQLETVKRADSIVLLDGGIVAAQGSHDALLGASALYRNLWTTQHDTPGWHRALVPEEA